MTAALTLYAWGNELDRVKEMLYAAEGEWTPEIEAEFEAVELGFTEKAERVALFIRELQSSAKAVKSETERLAARAKSFERAAENLKGYLLAQMERAEIPKVEGRLVTVRVQKSPPSVKTTLDQDTLGRMRSDLHTALFVKTVPESYGLDTEYVKAIWKNGKPLPEGIEVSQGVHVRIV